METLLAGVSQEPRALLLTHIHLDHAGATGALVERFPDLEVWVHSRGAPHLVDPARLLASAERIYGDRCGRCGGGWCRCPSGTSRVLEGGRGDLGRRAAIRRRVHARPCLPPRRVLRRHRRNRVRGRRGGRPDPARGLRPPPTPPPDIDVEAWMRSIDLVAEREPRSWRSRTSAWSTTGAAPRADEAGADEQAELVRRLLDEHGDTDEAVARVRRRGRPAHAEARRGPSCAGLFEVGSPVEQRGGPAALLEKAGRPGARVK